jgi:hypothetical protein
VGTPSCADVAVLLLEGLEEEPVGFFPVCSCLIGESEALGYRYLDYLVGIVTDNEKNKVDAERLRRERSDDE